MVTFKKTTGLVTYQTVLALKWWKFPFQTGEGLQQHLDANFSVIPKALKALVSLLSLH
jgi:hypothetical protein